MTEHEKKVAVQNFSGAVKNAMGRGKSRAEAVRQVAKRDPECHARYLQATNAAPPQLNKAEKALAIQNFNDAVRDKMVNGKMDRAKAVVAVATKNPELHAQFLAATHKEHR
jgi:hypothetical protein